MTFPISSICAFTISPLDNVSQPIDFWAIGTPLSSTNLEISPLVVCSSTDLCGQLLEAVLLDADKHTIFFVSEDFDRYITYYDMLDNYSRSSPEIIVRSLHLSVNPLILFDSTYIHTY